MLFPAISGCSEGTAMHSTSQFLRRDAAAEYLTKTYGFGAARTLAKGVVTGDTPEFHKAGRILLYTREALDRCGRSARSANLSAARRNMTLKATRSKCAGVRLA
jgi:hypothetical protein